MRLSWLDQMVDQGRLSKTAQARIYGHCNELVKEADNDIDAGMRIMSSIMPFLAPVIMGVVTPVVGSMILGRLGKKENEKVHALGHKQTMDSLLTDPAFKDHQHLVMQRFNEVGSIAPTVAANQPLLTAILKKKLHTGFSHDDITGLAKIQASYSSSLGAQQALQAKMPAYQSEQPKMFKAASDELIGRVAANNYLLLKEAGIFTGQNAAFIGSALKQTAAAAAVSGVVALGAGAINAGLAYRDKRLQQQQLASSFTRAMDINHPGTDLLNANPMKAREVFDSLVHFAPNVALQPMAARTFMNKVLEADTHDRGALDTSDIKSLSEIERNMVGAGGGSAFLKGFVPALTAGGFEDAMKGTRKAYLDPAFHKMEQSAAKQYGLSLSSKGSRYTKARKS